MSVENNTSIGIAPERLWGFLIEPRSWEKWWPAVTFARSGDFKPLREQSTFEASLTLGRLKTTLRGEVTLLAEPRALTWTARLWGVPLRQEWYLSKTGRGTRFIARTRFSGFGGLLLRWLRIQRRWAAMQARQGRSLKRVAERML